MSFKMPEAEILAKLSTDELDNLRIEAEKEAIKQAKIITDLCFERNELKREDIILADKILKARQLRRELLMCADELKSRFWQARNGY